MVKQRSLGLPRKQNTAWLRGMAERDELRSLFYLLFQLTLLVIVIEEMRKKKLIKKMQQSNRMLSHTRCATKLNLNVS